ncbi:hypothetical protein D3C87_1887910 [compost metagenome]
MPEATKAVPSNGLTQAVSTSPPMMAVTSFAPPVYGMCCNWVPAIWLKYSPVRCAMEPTPTEP